MNRLRSWAIWTVLLAFVIVSARSKTHASSEGSSIEAQPPKPGPIVTDRPDFTESTETVPSGMAQLETGFTFSRSGDSRDYSLGEVLFRISTGPRTELRLGANSFAWSRDGSNKAAGFQDATLGMKWAVSEGAESFRLGSPQTALIFFISVPTGSRDYRVRSWQPGMKLCLGWDISERVGMTSNFDYLYASEEGKRYSQSAGSLSLSYELSTRLGSYFEYFGFFPGSRGGSRRNYLNGGLTYLLNNDLQLDLRAGAGLNGLGNDYFAGTGLSIRW